MRLRAFFPFLEWLPNYSLKDLRGDLMGGLTVAVMLVPQGMAYGLLTGLDPVDGLYAGIVPLIIYAFFGTSRKLSVGPTALVSLLVLAGISDFVEPGDPKFLQLAIATALIAGIIQLLLGFFRLGILINFLSQPVIEGFTAAAALIIGLSQLRNLLGIDITRSNQIHIIFAAVVEKIDQIHWPTFLIGLAGIAFIYGLKKINRAIPGSVLAVIGAILFVYYLQLDQMGVAIVGTVPEGLPSFSVPMISFQEIRQIFPLALTICLISFIESLAIGRTIESDQDDYKLIPNQELIALGLSKVGGAFFQAFPTTGSFTRSAVNDQAGARTGVSSIIAALGIATTLLFFTPLFYYLPKAMLGAIIVVAVIGLVKYKEAVQLWKTDRRDFFTLIATFIATLTLGIQDGVLIGIVLSIAIMIYRNSKPHLAVLGRLPATQHYRNIDRFTEAKRHDELMVVRFDAQLYFGNASYFEEEIEKLVKNEGPELKVFVLDASNIHDIDSSGVHALEKVVNFLTKHGVGFYLANPIGPVRDILSRNGLIEKIGIEHCFLSVADAVQYFEDENRSASNPSSILQQQWRDRPTSKTK